MSYPIDKDLGIVPMQCPLGDGYLANEASGPAGHRRVCPNCGLVLVMPRVALAKAMRRVAQASRRRRRAS